MIEIQAKTQRTFVFPAPLPETQAYYGDFNRVVRFLRYVSLVQARNNGRFRLLYSITEVGAYSIRIFADVETEFTVEDSVLHVRTVSDVEPVRTKVGLRSLTAQGSYDSQSIFQAEGNQTRIDYHVQLAAKLPTPLGLTLIPDSVLNRIADSITRRRMNEIIDIFITRSISAYPQWLASRRELAD